MTSAPRSASMVPQNGPAHISPISRARTPASGSLRGVASAIALHHAFRPQTINIAGVESRVGRGRPEDLLGVLTESRCRPLSLCAES